MYVYGEKSIKRSRAESESGCYDIQVAALLHSHKGTEAQWLFRKCEASILETRPDVLTICTCVIILCI